MYIDTFEFISGISNLCHCQEVKSALAKDCHLAKFVVTRDNTSGSQINYLKTPIWHFGLIMRLAQIKYDEVFAEVPMKISYSYIP